MLPVNNQDQFVTREDLRIAGIPLHANGNVAQSVLKPLTHLLIGSLKKLHFNGRVPSTKVNDGAGQDRERGTRYHRKPNLAFYLNAIPQLADPVNGRKCNARLDSGAFADFG